MHTQIHVYIDTAVPTDIQVYSEMFTHIRLKYDILTFVDPYKQSFWRLTGFLDIV